LGGGPDALISEGLPKVIERAGHKIVDTLEAGLDPMHREPGRTAVNIGTLGASTAELVQKARESRSACFILAGDDTAAVGVVSGLELAHGADARLGIVWLDAHGDFNTPETSYSGILMGMSLAVIAGLAGPNWRSAARMPAPVPTHRLLLAGVRELDEKEEALIKATDAQVLTTADLRNYDPLLKTLERFAEECDLISVHLDLDLLDPHLIPSSMSPAEHGLDVEETIKALAAIFATEKVVALTICGLNPGGGARAARSIKTSMAVIEGSLAEWKYAP
jgi:arginase